MLANTAKKVRALSAKQIIEKKRKVHEFTDRFHESFGNPEQNATWMIWGKSGNGKTHFVLTLVKYMAQRFGPIDYVSLEEGDKKSFAIALEHVEMQDVIDFKLVPPISKEVLIDRILTRRGIFGIVVDSVQYSGISHTDHFNIKNDRKAKNKMLIYISHANGNNPDGKTADKIRYDADVKVHIIGFVGMVRSRYGGNKPFVIWEQGAKKYWGKKYKSVIEGKYWPGDKK